MAYCSTSPTKKWSIIMTCFRALKRRKTDKGKAPETSRARDSDSDEERAPRETVASALLPTDLHPNLRFNSRISRHFNKWNAVLTELRDKEFVLGRTVDWAPLEMAGVDLGIRRKLTQRALCQNTGITYAIRDWEKFFAIEEQVYVELCHEFYSTVELLKPGHGGEALLSFRLGGKARKISLYDMARCLELYTAEEWGSTYIHHFITHAERVTENFNGQEAWARLSDRAYSPGDNAASRLRDWEFRVIQRFISNTITQRESNTEKVSKCDLWYLDMMARRRPISIPYGVAYFLSKHGKGARGSSKISGGYYITKIAKYFRVNLNPESHPYNLVPRNMHPIGANQYTACGAIRKHGNSYIPYVGIVQPEEDEEMEEEEEDEEEPQQDPTDMEGLIHGFQNNLNLGFAGVHTDIGGLRSQFGNFQHVEDNRWGQVQNRWGTEDQRWEEFDQYRRNQEEYQRRNSYNQEVLQYGVDWGVHNVQRIYEPDGYNRATPYHQAPVYHPESAYHYPPYDRNAAFAELQQQQQQEPQPGAHFAAGIFGPPPPDPNQPGGPHYPGFY